MNQAAKISKHNRSGSISTKRKYSQFFENFVVHVGENFNTQNIRNISNKHVASFIESEILKGNSASTIKTKLSAIRFYHDKIDRAKHRIATNEELNYTQKRVTRGVNRTWSTSEYNNMINFATKQDPLKAAAMTIARKQGLRIHEVTRQDIAKIERELTTKDYLSIKGKNGKWREVPLNEEVRSTWCDAIQVAKEAGNTNKIFVSDNQKTHQAIQSIQDFIINHRDKFEELGHRAEGINMTIHGLRHCYAQEQYLQFKKNGCNDRLARLRVSKLLGHERDEVTHIYLTD